MADDAELQSEKDAGWGVVKIYEDAVAEMDWGPAAMLPELVPFEMAPVM